VLEPCPVLQRRGHLARCLWTLTTSGTGQQGETTCRDWQGSQRFVFSDQPEYSFLCGAAALAASAWLCVTHPSQRLASSAGSQRIRSYAEGEMQAACFSERSGDMHYHYGNNGDSGGEWTGPDFSGDWHTYAVDWEPDAIVWYVDGIERRRYTDAANITNKPMYLIANLAVGGDWPGSPDSTTPLPASYQIDHIRVWQKANL
jgi:hypothetical protein